jgi:hypothetical protein
VLLAVSRSHAATSARKKPVAIIISPAASKKHRAVRMPALRAAATSTRASWTACGTGDTTPTAANVRAAATPQIAARRRTLRALARMTNIRL